MFLKRSLIVFLFLGFVLFFPSIINAQKKSLDHTVYDGWQSIGEKIISNDGLWIAYSVDVQEGDGLFVLQKSDSTLYFQIERGYMPSFTDNNEFLILKIKAPFSDTRQAKIKKKKTEDFPKDSLGIYNLSNGNFEKIPEVLSYKLAKNSGKWLAYQLVATASDTIKNSISKDSTSLKNDTGKLKVPIILEQTPNKKQKRKLSANQEQDFLSALDAEGDESLSSTLKEGTNLIVRNLLTQENNILPRINEYHWSENGKILLLESSISKNDKSIIPAVYIWRNIENRYDTLLLGGNDFKNFTIDKEGYQIAFLAERDSSFKSIQKFYKLWHWKNGEKKATILADKFTEGMHINWTINEYFHPYFSKSGSRIFFGTNPVKSIRDTSLIDIDLVKLDIWHYNDDYIQPYQLKNADQEGKKSYLTMVELDQKKLIQLADLNLPQVVVSTEGDENIFLGISDKASRIEMQWTGDTKKDIYLVESLTGARKLIKRDLDGLPGISPMGTYIYWYDFKEKNYFTYRNNSFQNITHRINYKLYDEEYDMPSNPTPYGIMSWEEKDSSLFVYDRYDIWQIDPNGVRKPFNITAGKGRLKHIRYRLATFDLDKKYIDFKSLILLKTFNEENKNAGFSSIQLGASNLLKDLNNGAFTIGSILKAKNTEMYLYTRETTKKSPNIFVSKNFTEQLQLSNINPQQSQYNWITAEIFSWKAYNGKNATGLVYKPENFDRNKKYPMIVYFYETYSDGLNNYLPPAPTPSRLNIPFFVSRGYIVFIPDIHYMQGYPGKSAFDYIVSGTRALVKRGSVDSTHIGIQGQSWGGYQTAYVITRTNLFSAAWAGAPVSNMTSAYGGIRWESGMNRQFQYEKTQSRIGATLWEKPNLYIENSPLFYLPKVKTPLVIMSNDNDGAVPWYQGIEMFTAMRRLGKKVWLLNYNGEAHNLVERKNRKDIQIREQQFFDWLLKGEKPSIWLTEGVPAIEKGKNWGLEYAK